MYIQLVVRKLTVLIKQQLPTPLHTDCTLKTKGTELDRPIQMKPTSGLESSIVINTDTKRQSNQCQALSYLIISLLYFPYQA